MDLQLETAIDWTRAQDGRRLWQPSEREVDIFNGESCWQRSRLENVDVLRLSVTPTAGASIPDSFTVVASPDWSTIAQPDLPLCFEWQQSRPGRFDFYFKLARELKCLALGERFSGLNVRGQKHTLISTDSPHHHESTDAMYKSVPFLVLGSADKFYGLYLDSPAPCRFDLDSELTEEGHIELLTRRGFRIYLLGPSPLASLVQAFTGLVGRAKLPPLWSLGHQQCRWSYPDETTVRELAREFRQRKIPCDTLVLDIDYMDEYRVFTSSDERFPQFEKMISDLAAENFKVVTIIDPGVKQDSRYKQFTDGESKDYFCKTADGKTFIEKVWPGPSAFPDFLKRETRAWWASQHKFLTDKGVAGIWNDMNEPAFFGVTKILPNDLTELPDDKDQICLHEAEEGIVPHLEVRNLYGLLMSRSTHEGLLLERPNQRPFVLSRSGTAGIQRYAAVWLGDNKSWYEHLRKSIPMLLNIGLSGIPFAGVDIGGFWENALPELVIRWYELGIFYPFFRNHCALSFRGQEAFAYAPHVEESARKLIETRYRLLPYIRNLFWEHLRTGAPLMRPLMWHYSTDPIAADIDCQFMFGRDILVAPILERGHEYRSVYLPAGNWYHLETNELFEGERAHTVKMPLGAVPAFARQGAILPLAEVMQHTSEYDSKSITFHVYGEHASGSYFEDDGITFDYETGKYNEFELSFQSGEFHCSTVRREFVSSHQYRFCRVGNTFQEAITL
jgi:alpha-glucosidase